MKFIYALLVVAVYADDQENLNIDVLLSDQSNFQDFVTCFLDTAPCNDVAAAFKKDVPAAVLHSCDMCTPEQKHIVNAFIVAFKKVPEYQKAFIDKYDPQQIYLDKLEAAVVGF